MLKVETSMLVAPFQCVWLVSEENSNQLDSDYGGVEFEVCGSTDATVMFKRSPGSNRLETEDNSYCVIFGSNRNRCVRIERQGECQVSVEGCWTKLSPIEFRKFWVYHKEGTFKLGKGSVSTVPLLSWTDPDPVRGFLHVGLSSWDGYNTYRSVKTLNWPLFTQETGVSKLLELCSAALMKDKSTLRSCLGIQLLCDHDLPGMDPLLENFVFNLASDFEEVAQYHIDRFVKLPCSAVAAILKSPALVSCPCHSWYVDCHTPPELVCGMLESHILFLNLRTRLVCIF